MYDVSSICPKLVKLEFDSTFVSVSDQHINTTLAGLNERNKLIDTINQNMKELDLQLPNLSSSYIELIKKYSSTQLASLSITLYDIDMYDWIEEVGWDDDLKLAGHMRLIPNASISLRANNDYDPPPPRDESRMTQFYKLLGAITVGRPNLYHTIQASDFRKNHILIRVNNNKKVLLEYGLGYEDYGEFASQRGDQGTEEGEEEEEEEEALIKRISDAFELPVPDLEKSLIGPNVINNWSFVVCRIYPSIPYRLLKYALVNSPRLQYFELNPLNTYYNVRLSASPKIRYRHQPTANDPVCTSQECLKYVRFEGFSPTQDYLDLLSSHLPNIETVSFTDKGSDSTDDDDTRQRTTFNFDLTVFKKLNAFHMNIDTVVNMFDKNPFDYVFFHLIYDGGNEEGFYSIDGKERPYKLKATTQRFILECTQKEELTTKLLIFELNNKIEEFAVIHRALC